MAHIVIPGAGIGGMPLAYEMREAARPEVRITVISNVATFHFVASNPRVAVNWRKRNDIEFAAGPCLPKRRPTSLGRRSKVACRLAAFLNPHGAPR